MNRTAEIGRVLPTVLLLLGAAVFVTVVVALHTPDLVSNDGIQYLLGARSLMAGDGFLTSVLIYDANFAPQTLPAPQTTFPPGFSLAIAIPALLGLPELAAGILVSVVASLLTAWLIFRTLGGYLGACAALVWLLNAHGLTLTVIVASDILFAALVTGSLVQAALGLEPGAGRRPLWMAGALVAAAVAVRYAGVFMMITLCVYFGLRWLSRRRLRDFLDGVAVVGPGVLVLGAMFLRNALLTGDSDGGALDAFERSWAEVLRQCFWGAVTVFGIASRDAPAFPIQVALIASAAVATIVMLRGRGSALRATFQGLRADPLVRLCILFVFVYVGILLYLSHTRNSIILLPRYLLPVVPPGLIVAGRFGRFALREGAAVLRLGAPIVAAVAGGLLLGSWSYWPAIRGTYIDGNPIREATATLAAPGPDGRPCGEALLAHLPPNAPILADPGHSLGWLLRHPTLGPIGSAYSAHTWDDAEIRALVKVYGVEFAVDLQGQSQRTDSPTFWQELRIHGPPPWFTPIYTATDLTLYRIAP